MSRRSQYDIVLPRHLPQDLEKMWIRLRRPVLPRHPPQDLKEKWTRSRRQVTIIDRKEVGSIAIMILELLIRNHHHHRIVLNIIRCHVHSLVGEVYD